MKFEFCFTNSFGLLFNLALCIHDGFQFALISNATAVLYPAFFIAFCSCCEQFIIPHISVLAHFDFRPTRLPVPFRTVFCLFPFRFRFSSKLFSEGGSIDRLSILTPKLPLTAFFYFSNPVGFLSVFSSSTFFLVYRSNGKRNGSGRAVLKTGQACYISYFLFIKSHPSTCKHREN